jgi:hypothetical protein
MCSGMWRGAPSRCRHGDPSSDRQPLMYCCMWRGAPSRCPENEADRWRGVLHMYVSHVDSDRQMYTRCGEEWEGQSWKRRESERERERAKERYRVFHMYIVLIEIRAEFLFLLRFFFLNIWRCCHSCLFRYMQSDRYRYMRSYICIIFYIIIHNILCILIWYIMHNNIQYI